MVGTTISQYEILEELGSGGMGVVYKALDTKLDRTVALKFLPAKVARDTTVKERFIQEAKAASSLDDPHICTIFDISETDDGQLFIVMAYYDGSTLDALIKKRQIKIEDAASIARQMAKGLSTAHEADIVHRDVKPGNVMVTRKGLVKLLDFGVAKLGESSNLTREGSAIGTASYMSPEQARGESVDARSDIWSIGAVLYEMLTGSRPFGGGYEAAVAYSIINEQPPPIAPARPDAPDGLIEIVEKALSKNPGERYPTARAIVDDLGAFSGETVVETAEKPVVVSREAVPSLRRISLIFTVAAVIVLGLAYGAMILFGLPDWVFPTAVLLVVLGFPIMLYSATIEKQRAKMDSGEKARLSGIRSWLSTKLALRGGLMAGGALLVAVVAYTVLRASGVGPFASLITSGALESQGKLIVTDFENRTIEADLGQTVSEALRIDLSQSDVIQIMDHSAMQSALQRMEMNADTLVGAGVGLLIAEREGVKAIIEGEISAIGSSFQIAARIVAADGGIQLAAFRENAASFSDFFPAIDRLSASLREEIGESLVSIRGNEPLENVTTRSIEALRHYTRGEQAHEAGRIDEAVTEIDLAIAADSNFGMAYRKRTVLPTVGFTQEERIELYERAYALRDRMTTRERLLTEGTYFYYHPDKRDYEAAIRAYEELLRRWPDDITALNNLSILYRRDNRFVEAEPLLRRALAVDESYVFRSNLVNSLFGLQKIEELRQEISDYDRLYPTTIFPADGRMRLAFAVDSLDEAMRWAEVRDIRARSDENEASLPTPFNTDILQAQGRLEEASKKSDDYYASETWRTVLERRAVDDSTRDAQERLRVRRMERQRARMYFRLTGDRTRLDAIDPDFWASREAEIEDDEDRLFFHLNRASSAAERKAFEEAIAELEEAQEYLSSAPAAARENIERSIEELRTYSLGMTSGDPAEAASRMLELLEEETCFRCGRDQVGELYERAGDAENAIEAYKTFVSAFDRNAIFQDRGMVALIHFRLGVLYENMNDLDNAISHYSKMVDRWQNADPVLQPQVSEARRRIEALLDRKAEEGG